MSIIVIGAGQIGQFIASKLANENKDVIVIENDETKIAMLSDEMDVQVILGNGASPATLTSAGINQAHMLIAVTDSDEVNLLSCMIANQLSTTPIKIARVRNPNFYGIGNEEILKKLDIDLIINPDKEAADAILRILTVPGAIDVIDFFEGRIKIVGIKVKEGSPLIEVPLENASDIIGSKKLLITTILRNGETITPSGKDSLMIGDLIYFISEDTFIPQIMQFFGYKNEKIKRVMIFGGTHIGLHLAEILEQKDIQVKIIEPDPNVCSKLVRRLNKSVVLNDEATNQEFLLQENIKNVDAFISVTDDDEDNALASLLAKRLGAEWSITITKEINYIPLITTIGVDVVVSPRLIVNSEILHFIRQGKVLSVSTLQEDLEILEIEALETSEIVGNPIKKIKFPKETLVICIKRNNEIFIPNGETIIKPQDKVLIQTSTRSISKVEKLFTVKLEYF